MTSWKIEIKPTGEVIINDNPITNPWLRYPIALLAATILIICAAAMVVITAVLAATCPIWLTTDLILKACGRKGFVHYATK